MQTYEGMEESSKQKNVFCVPLKRNVPLHLLIFLSLEVATAHAWQWVLLDTLTNCVRVLYSTVVLFPVIAHIRSSKCACVKLS
jgi:hypothetical protein